MTPDPSAEPAHFGQPPSAVQVEREASQATAQGQEPQMDLIHCVYCSTSTESDFGRSELDLLLEKCRANNAKLDITGMLLYRDGAFFQVLEGERSAVEGLFAKIEQDKRHTRVTKIIVEPISERAFAEWTMGFANISAKELGEIPGLNDFFARGESYMHLGEGRAKTLLGAFKEGRWRLSLT